MGQSVNGGDLHAQLRESATFRMLWRMLPRKGLVGHGIYKTGQVETKGQYVCLSSGLTHLITK
jgi:hypothetical protein